jgi:hypothetical protein
MESTRAALRDWLGQRLKPEPLTWLDDTCAAVASGAPARRFDLAFSSAARRVGKTPLDLDDGAARRAHDLRAGWQPAGWTTEQAARTLLVTHLPSGDPGEYRARLDRSFESADIGELVALYQALPLLPHPAIHEARCREGLRSNITPVFCAVAHRNPYPAEQLADEAWNQMVLKALFVGTALDPIEGLDGRANASLARMLRDYAHERWSAGRPVHPELWRCVGPFASDALDDLERALRDGDEATRRAATLALGAADDPRATDLANKYPIELPAGFGWSDLTGESK